MKSMGYANQSCSACVVDRSMYRYVYDMIPYSNPYYQRLAYKLVAGNRIERVIGGCEGCHTVWINKHMVLVVLLRKLGIGG